VAAFVDGKALAGVDWTRVKLARMKQEAKTVRNHPISENGWSEVINVTSPARCGPDAFPTLEDVSVADIDRTSLRDL